MTTQWGLRLPTWEGGAGGVGSIGPSCGASNQKAIGFVFGTPFNAGVDAACTNAMFVTGVMVGLDVSMQSEDFISYGNCTPKTWVDADVACGESMPRDCQCTMQPMQNSYQTLLAEFGACP